MNTESVIYYKDWLGRRHIITWGNINPDAIQNLFDKELSKRGISPKIPKFSHGVWFMTQGIEFKIELTN
ncbi:hypothetical protein [Fructobacillus tropaeoli]|uniref:Uncharacterized protein n=1 Tax=Fructobacillus tropaeoli TaxID=709323 RepID=A0A3F3H6E4_9LACO|nr:hypothetical protein [Fructobacillus tropaeoli]GAP05082.1 hypothetical protein FTRO_0430020 [Fructobacillus tropaeoli]